MADDGRSNFNQALLETGFLDGANALYVEEMLARFKANPDSVAPDWREMLARLAEPEPDRKASWARADWRDPAADEMVAALTGAPPAAKPALREARTPTPLAVAAPKGAPVDVQQAARDSVKAVMMIRAHRMRGHLAADLDPLGIQIPGSHEELDPAHYGFGAADLDRPIFIDGMLGFETATVRKMLEVLRKVYCSRIGFEFMHISDPAQKSWLQQRIEGENPDQSANFTLLGKKAILRKLTEAEVFEQFIHRRFPGTKRFGIDGGEAMAPALEQIIKVGGKSGLSDIILGMPHRGRLNVLTAVMGKPYRAVFNEFLGGDGNAEASLGTGDVKYHLGWSSDREFDGLIVHLSLTANPSHLEAVDPVVLGKARAKQARGIASLEAREESRRRTLPLLLHGDAAFAGQGMVSECFGLSGLKGYRTGGAIHFIVNNQIGFTTDPRFSRSSPYCSDVALMVQAPIFHVNGDDPEAVVFATRVATEFRQTFQKDVVIDLVCYRRYGHNEGDDPTMTQPLMYAKIAQQKPVRAIYAERLIAEGVINRDEADAMVAEMEALLDSELEAGKTYRAQQADRFDKEWSHLGLPRDDDRRGRTSVDIPVLQAIGIGVNTLPDSVAPHRTVARVIEARRKAISEDGPLDWAIGEQLAFATLLKEKFEIRLSGQDSARGTFSHRHSQIVDQKTEERHTPLNHLADGQGVFEVYDSSLSEEAVLGFEYGYSLSAPNTLVLWEAQFGDFVNGAQVIIDQFIASAEQKWLRSSGLVMLLPHGYEGQGPEHSSARLERFLQSCAQDNMQVANVSTPANYFHILRRQIHRDFRKPLILMSPKSLLRHKKCVSWLREMGPDTTFHRVLADDAERGFDLTPIRLVPDDRIRRVVLCSGKVYYDLLEEREKRGISDVYLLRVEQFYPFPHQSLKEVLARFTSAEMVWCQEEPRNMGAFSFVEPWLQSVLEEIGARMKRVAYAGRPASASTAVGLGSSHKTQLEAFVEAALGEKPAGSATGK